MFCHCSGCDKRDSDIFVVGDYWVCNTCYNIYEQERNIFGELDDLEILKKIIEYHKYRYEGYISKYKNYIPI